MARQALKELYVNNLRCNRRQGCIPDYELRRSDTFATGVTPVVGSAGAPITISILKYY